MRGGFSLDNIDYAVCHLDMMNDIGVLRGILRKRMPSQDNRMFWFGGLYCKGDEGVSLWSSPAVNAEPLFTALSSGATNNGLKQCEIVLVLQNQLAWTFLCW